MCAVRVIFLYENVMTEKYRKTTNEIHIYFRDVIYKANKFASKY